MQPHNRTLTNGRYTLPRRAVSKAKAPRRPVGGSVLEHDYNAPVTGRAALRR